jgi:hypothetical protein
VSPRPPSVTQLAMLGRKGSPWFADRMRTALTAMVTEHLPAEWTDLVGGRRRLSTSASHMCQNTMIDFRRLLAAIGYHRQPELAMSIIEEAFPWNPSR